MYPLPCLFACDRPYPEPEGKGGRSGQPPVGTINVVAGQPSQPVARHNAIADTEASTHPNGHSTTARSTRALHGHGHRTLHSIHASTRHPTQPTAASKRIAPPPRTPVTHPVTQCLEATSPSHSHGQPPRKPHPVSPWERRLAHGRSRARAAKTFPTGTRRPSENSGASAFRFLPCAAAFPQAPSAPQGAPRGRAPTRGGRQPWEGASTRGRARQSART